MDSALLPPKIEDRRLVSAFLFTALPAAPVLVGSIYLVSRPGSMNFIIHPLGLLFLVGALLAAAFPVRLAMYVFALRESSPQRSKVWAAILCAVPSLGFFLVLPAAVDSGITLGRVSLLAFFGCYLAAFAVLMLHVVHGSRKQQNSPDGQGTTRGL